MPASERPRTKTPSIKTGPTLWAGWPTVIFCAGVVALIAKVALASNTYGTKDIYLYEMYWVWYRAVGVGVYNAALEMNHPPSMLHFLDVIGWLASATPRPFEFWFRLASILADAGSLWLVWSLLANPLRTRERAWSILLFALAPVSLMVSGYHGNTDPILIFFVLLSVWLAEKKAPPWASGVALGFAFCVKIVPLVAAPAMFFYQDGRRRKLQFLAGCAGVVLIAWQPFLFQDPLAIWHKVFGYRSAQGLWGLSYLAAHFTPWLSVKWPSRLYQTQGGLWAVAACAAAGVWMNLRKPRPRLFAQVGLAFFLFLALANGFGVQYLAWLSPWVVELGLLPAAIYFAASGVAGFCVYNYTSQGMPWSFGLFPALDAHGGYLSLALLMTWGSILLSLWLSWHRMRQGNRPPVKQEDGAGAWVLAGGLAAVLLFHTIGQQMDVQEHGKEMHATLNGSKVAEVRAQTYADAAFMLYRLDRYDAAIRSAEGALKLKPDQDLALAIQAASNAGLHDWDAAIAAATQALRSNPSSGIARASLTWAQTGKQLGNAPFVPTFEYYMDISGEEYQLQHFQACVDAAQQALKLAPNRADAYNNMAAALNTMGRFDEGIAAAEQAIRLAPDFQLARNNLAFAQERKKMLEQQGQ